LPKIANLNLRDAILFSLFLAAISQIIIIFALAKIQIKVKRE
jgi:hypothetical protein